MIEKINNFFRDVGEYFVGTFSSLPTIIIVLLVIAIIIMLITVGLITVSVSRGWAKKRAKPPAPSKHADGRSDHEKRQDKMPPLGGWATEYLTKKGYFQVSELSMSFLKALEFLKTSLNTSNYKYRLPWYLLIGPEASGKSGMLEGSNLNLPVGLPNFGEQNSRPECRWWFLNRGVILDIKGRMLLNARGTGADEKGWRSLLILLSRYRAARPLNGIILTISAEELYGKYRLSIEEINDRATFLAHKLQAAQASLGLRLPVYLVVTKSDIIPGFQSFCDEIPKQNKQNILGWSSPYSPQTAYTAKWIDEAFASIQSGLNRIRTEVFASGRATENRDGLFAFPVELSTLKERLGIYINNVFKGQDADESLMMRGMYFVGDSGEDALRNINFGDLDGGNQQTEENTTLDLNKPDRRKIFFIDDLINEKVLYEAGLGRPLHGKLMTLNRGINIAKSATAAVAILGTVGLYSAHEHFQEQRRHMLPVLQKMNAVLYEMRNIKINQPGQSTLMFDTFARQLITMMDTVDRTKFVSLFVPASWFSPLTRDLNETLKISYQQIIIRTIYIDLLLKSRELLNLRPDVRYDRSESIAQLMKPTAGREFALFKHYVSEMERLNSMIFKFNNLRSAQDAKDLDDLVSYTFNARLPQQFVDQYRSIQELIENMPFPPIDLMPYEKMARETLGVLYQNYLTAMFDVKDHYSFPGRLNKFLSVLSNRQSNKTPDLVSFRQFSIELAEGQNHLGETGKTWLDQEFFNPGDDFNKIFDQIDKNRLFGNQVSQFLVDQTAIGFENLKRQLKIINESLIFGPQHLPRGPMNKKKEEQYLSKSLAQLATALSELFSEPYMAEASDTPFSYRIPEGKMVRWDGNMVQVAYEMARSFDDYLNNHVKQFPAMLQENLRLLARESLQANVVDLLARAQNFVGIPESTSEVATAEEILNSVSDELTQTGPKFVKLMELLNIGNVGFSFVELRNMLAESYYWYLKKVEMVNQSYAPFAVRDMKFKWWNGQPGAAYAGYAVMDATDLQAYVDIQREQIGKMVRYAQPLVAFLGSNAMIEAQGGDKTMLTRWKRIVDQYNAAKKKKAGSSLSALEEFVLKKMNTITAEKAPEEIPVLEVNQPSGDYFSEIERNLKRGILGRAEMLKRTTAIRNYEKLVDHFTSYLGGKYPFVASGYTSGQGEADPEYIRQFFNMMDEMGGTPEKVLDQIHQLGAPAKDMMSFLYNMQEVRGFMENYILGKADGDTPSVDLKVDFRTNRKRESGGNNIVDWYARAGDGARINRMSESRSIRWYYGSSLEFGFKFASSAPKPQADSSRSYYNTDDSTARFTFANQWALIAALSKLRDRTLSGSGGIYVLNFSIPTSSTRVQGFNRITLTMPATSAKGVGKLISIPNFPLTAPSVSAEVKAYADQSPLADGAIKPHQYRHKKADEIAAVDSAPVSLAQEQYPADDGVVVDGNDQTDTESDSSPTTEATKSEPDSTKADSNKKPADSASTSLDKPTEVLDQIGDKLKDLGVNLDGGSKPSSSGLSKGDNSDESKDEGILSSITKKLGL